VAIIKKSKTPPEAKEGLMQRFSLSEIQAQAILDLRLQRLTGLERDKIIQEYLEIQDLIKRLKEILASEKLVYKIITEELTRSATSTATIVAPRSWPRSRRSARKT
jgi:DNA gyrase subunit A